VYAGAFLSVASPDPVEKKKGGVSNVDIDGNNTL
jgi:hypothetical protein